MENKPLQLQVDQNGCWCEIEIIQTPVGSELQFITLGMERPQPPLELMKDEKPGKLWGMK